MQNTGGLPLTNNGNKTVANSTNFNNNSTLHPNSLTQVQGPEMLTDDGKICTNKSYLRPRNPYLQ